MRLISGIDTAMPDVGTEWNCQSRWNQSERYWQDDFRQLAGCGFDLLRWQVPWSLVESKRGDYHWELVDPKVELATKLGLEIFYPVVHFNLPQWIAGRGVRHSVYSGDLADYVAEYTDRILARYHFRLVIPIVEVQMDAFQRGWLGNWQPHQKSRTSYRLIYSNLVKAFKASSAVARSHGATVFCSEPAPEVPTVLDLKDAIDVAGIDLCPHLHKQWPVIGYLRKWWEAAGVPLCISEFGAPEAFDPATGHAGFTRFVKAGVDRHRVMQARQLRDAIEQAHQEGIPIPYGGWYPGMGNTGWSFSLAKERKGADCDRAGLMDLARQSGGDLQRVPCTNLIREIQGLRDVGVTPAPLVDTIPVPAYEESLAETPSAPAGVPAIPADLLDTPRISVD